MTKATSVISFTDSSSTSDISFTLEQVDYVEPSPDGFEDWLTETGRDNLSGSALFSAYNQYISGCDEDGILNVTLRARLSDISLEYNLRASYGQLGAAGYVKETRTEYLEFSLETEKSLDFGTIVSASWNGDAYDADNEIISLTPTLSGGTATVSQAVLGVLECQVEEELYEHELAITARTPTAAQLESESSVLDELYAATVWMFCNGSIAKKEIEMPDDFGTCSGGYGGSSVSVDPDEEDVKTYQVMIGDIFDYCSGDQITGYSIFIDDVQILTESVLLESGTHTVRVTAEGYTPTDEDDLGENDTFTLP
jgi:hypothetical protein